MFSQEIITAKTPPKMENGKFVTPNAKQHMGQLNNTSDNHENKAREVVSIKKQADKP